MGGGVDVGDGGTGVAVASGVGDGVNFVAVGVRETPRAGVSVGVLLSVVVGLGCGVLVAGVVGCEVRVAVVSAVGAAGGSAVQPVEVTVSSEISAMTADAQCSCLMLCCACTMAAGA